MLPEPLKAQRCTLTWIFAMVTVSIFGSAPLWAQSRTYTSDADFDSGTMLHVDHSTVHDELQLERHTTSYALVWIANSSRGTLVCMDAATGTILGEYRSAPEGRSRNPSRTAVDRAGNVWTGNRSEASGGHGSVV